MQGILSLICALRVLSADMDGEQAVASCRHLLWDAGIRETLTLQSLTDHSYITKAKCWQVSFTRPAGSISVVLDARSERALFIQTVPPHTANPNVQINGNLPPTPVGTRRQRVLLRRLGYDKAVRMERDGGYTNSPTSACFYPTLHNLRFFNINPTYAHRLDTQAETGALTYFSASDPLPSVNAWQPRLSAGEASAKIMAVALERMKRKGQMLPSATEKPKMELGYWKFQKEQQARLVWRLNHYIDMHGLPYGMGPYTIFADALTGEILTPDDTLMGPNP